MIRSQTCPQSILAAFRACGEITQDGSSLNRATGIQSQTVDVRRGPESLVWHNIQRSSPQGGSSHEPFSDMTSGGTRRIGCVFSPEVAFYTWTMQWEILCSDTQQQQILWRIQVRGGAGGRGRTWYINSAVKCCEGFCLFNPSAPLEFLWTLYSGARWRKSAETLEDLRSSVHVWQQLCVNVDFHILMTKALFRSVLRDQR